MKKLLSVLLVIAMLISAAALIACTNEETPESTTTTTTTPTTTTTTTTTTTKAGGNENPDQGGDDKPAEPTAYTITLDGKIDDWAGSHTIVTTLQSGATYTYYGLILEDGLYCALDAYTTGFDASEGGNWWDSPNFECFIGPYTGSENQRWISLTNKEGGYRMEGNVTEAAASYEAVEGAAPNHFIVEYFIQRSQLEDGWFYENGSIRVGMAADTNNSPNGTGAYVNPTDTHERSNRALVTANGVYSIKGYSLACGTNLIGAGSEWSYLTATGDANAAGEGWNTAVNADWQKANAPFGNRAGGATNAWGTNDNPADGTQTNAYLWVAKEFTVEDLDALDGLTLIATMFYDDTLTLYVNGEVVYEHTTGNAWNDGYDNYKLSEDIKSLLVEGKNVIAASLHQHHGGYEFDLALTATDDSFVLSIAK